MIPKIIHQTWKTSELPSKTLFCVESWKALNPTFKHILWSDEDILDFTKNNYPQYLNRVENFQAGIIKADFFRLLALYHFGGIYVDIDFECLVPFDQWQCIQRNKINAAYEPFSHSFIHGSFKQKLCNAFFASPPKMASYERLINTGNLVNDKKPLEVKRSYGPLAWSKLLQEKHLKKEINLIPRRSIYPIPDLTNSKVAIEDSCLDTAINKIEKRKFNALAVHYWDHSSVENTSILDSIEKKDLTLIKTTRDKHRLAINAIRESNTIKKLGAKARLITHARLLQLRLNLYI